MNYTLETALNVAQQQTTRKELEGQTIYVNKAINGTYYVSNIKSNSVKEFPVTAKFN